MEQRENFHVLVVDDDQRIRNLLGRYLDHEGFYTSTVASVEEAFSALKLFHFDILIVDVMMPGGNGTLLLSSSEISAQKLPPILFLSAAGKTEDRIHGLELGAKDYMVKPFEPRELVLRIHTILSYPSENKSKNQVFFGPACYHIKEKNFFFHGKRVVLTHTEQMLLEYFCHNANRIVLREELQSLFFTTSENHRIIDVHMNRLRKKIEENASQPQFLVSIRGQGYCLKTSS